MVLHFEKFQGTGNDFIMVNNMEGQYDYLSIEQIKTLCDRHFGIGADGLIKINEHNELDFEMEYFNPDGSTSFCGNGARCTVAFAHKLGYIENSCRFLAIDGIHEALIDGHTIAIQIKDVHQIKNIENDLTLHTGSPHFLRFVDDLSLENIFEFGKNIRYSKEFKTDGINVNLVEKISENKIQILTYERGVENETLSCGSGATACALGLAFIENRIGNNDIDVMVKGGQLNIKFEYLGNQQFQKIRLSGPTQFVFNASIDV